MLLLRRHASAQTDRGFNFHDRSGRGGWFPAGRQQRAEVVLVCLGRHPLHPAAPRPRKARNHGHLHPGQHRAAKSGPRQDPPGRDRQKSLKIFLPLAARSRYPCAWKMAYFSTASASERRNLTGKNRVWDFFRLPNETHPANRRQPLQPLRKIGPTAMKTASGIPCWPSRDPIGERGGMNLYGFVGNNGISYVDGDGRINVPGIFIGVGWELTIQITANVASGEDWYKIDVTDVVVAGAIGAFFPGAGDVLKGVTKGLAKQGKAIKAGAKALARAKGNLRKWKLAAKAKAAAEAEAQAWKDVAKIGAGVVAGKVASKAANAAADAIEEQFQGDCPPEINEDGIVTLPPLYILLDSESGKVIDVSEIPLGGRPIDPNNPPPFLIPDP